MLKISLFCEYSLLFNLVWTEFGVLPLDKNLNRNLNCLFIKRYKTIVLLTLTLSQGQFFNLSLKGFFRGLLSEGTPTDCLSPSVLARLPCRSDTQEKHGVGSPTQLVAIYWESKSRKQEVKAKQGANAGSKTMFLVASPPGLLAD